MLKISGSAVADGLIAALIGALITAAVSIYIFKKQLDIAISQQQMNLSRDLAKEFFQEGDNVYAKLRTAVESCKPLYRSWGGPFIADEINKYLGFFEDLGFYQRKDTITWDIIDHFFGYYIIEAFEYEELQRYVKDFRTKYNDTEAFKEFERMAKHLEADPKWQDALPRIRRLCKGEKRS